MTPVIFENLLVRNRWAHSLDIWYVASYGGPLPRLLKLSPGVKTGHAPGSASEALGQLSRYRGNYQAPLTHVLFCIIPYAS